jgi:uncharacterized protein Smg (DUF494 family)
MTLDNLLEEIKYGKEFIESKIDLGNIKSFIGEETKGLQISKRAEFFLKECDNSLSYIKKLARATRNFKEYENKIAEDVSVSTIYARMKVDSITEDINSALLELETKKVLRESSQENVGKIVAVLKHGLSQISKVKNVPLKKVREAPGLVEAYSKKESALIESVI